MQARNIHTDVEAAGVALNEEYKESNIGDSEAPAVEILYTGERKEIQ